MKPIDAHFTTKQQDVINCYLNDKPKILVLSGAKRSGKTHVGVFLFLMNVLANANKREIYIIGGASQRTISLNVLTVIEEMTRRIIKLDKLNGFWLFGNQIVCFDGEKSGSWKRMRGFTAKGAFINEATALNDSFVKEAISRCSLRDSRILMDTNPENPGHYVKTDYIDKAGHRLSTGRLNIAAFQFTLFDNTFLDPEYVESIVQATPSGMFTNRDVHGLWVAPEGVVYPDFSEENYIEPEQIQDLNFVRYFAGVDWGYEHKGVISVYGVTETGLRVRLEEHVARSRQVHDYWVDVALQVKSKYGSIPFYCDTARVDAIEIFEEVGINCKLANKAIIPGVEFVGGLFKTRLYVINKGACEAFDQEIYQYVWQGGSVEKPNPVNDDCMDTDRYALYTDHLAHQKPQRSAKNVLDMLGLR